MTDLLAYHHGPVAREGYRREILVIVLIAICGFGLLIWTSKPAEMSEEDRQAVAITAAQDYIKNSLIAPETAHFPWKFPRVFPDGSPDTYQFESYVDTQNAFGAMIREYYSCRVFSDGKIHRVLECRID